MIVGLAGPILNPDDRAPGTGPLLIAVDGGWAEARDWPQRVAKIEALVSEAGAAGRTVAVVRLTDAPQEASFQTAEAWAGRAAGLQPQAWLPPDMAAWVPLLPAGSFETVWLSDGLDHGGRSDLLAALQARGAVQVVETARTLFGLHLRASTRARSWSAPAGCLRVLQPRSRSWRRDRSGGDRARSGPGDAAVCQWGPDGRGRHRPADRNCATGLRASCWRARAARGPWR